MLCYSCFYHFTLENKRIFYMQNVGNTLHLCKNEYTLVMELHKKLSVLGLSKKEERVLVALIDTSQTPLRIARETKVTRPAVYDILKKLKNRGLVTSQIVNGKKSWSLARKEDIDTALYEAKKVLLSITEGTEEIKGLSDGTVIVHRGKDAINALFAHMTQDHKNERLYNMQGMNIFNAWDTLVGKENVNEFNKNIKKNGILTEGIVPRGWYDDYLKVLGDTEGLIWAKGFEGRAAATYQINKEYFNHAGQIFMFKSSLYLMAMTEGIIIEIQNSEIQKMIKQMFSYIEDHAENIDVNDLLRKRIAALEEKVV